MRLSAVHLSYLLALGIVIVPLLDTSDAHARKRSRKKKPAVEKKVATATKVNKSTKGTKVAVLKFERFKTSDEVMKIFYDTLGQKIQEKKGHKVIQTGKVTIKEFALTVGCAKIDKQCLNNLSGFIKADQIIFGSVQQSDNVHLFTIKIFDFNKKDYVRIIEDQTVEGDLSKVKEVIPAVIESALHGSVGRLRVRIQGAPGAEIFFDGVLKAKGSVALNNLPLGEHVIKVKHPDGKTQTKRVILRKKTESVVVFKFASGIEPLPVEDNTTSALIIPGWVTLGVGVAALGFGAYNLYDVSNQESDAASAFDGQPLPSNDRDAELRRADISARQQDLDAAYTRGNIGLTVGFAGVLLGGGMLAYGYLGGPDTPPSANNDKSIKNMKVGVSPTLGGAAMSMGFQF